MFLLILGLGFRMYQIFLQQPTARLHTWIRLERRQGENVALEGVVPWSSTLAFVPRLGPYRGQESVADTPRGVGDWG